MTSKHPAQAQQHLGGMLKCSRLVQRPKVWRSVDAQTMHGQSRMTQPFAAPWHTIRLEEAWSPQWPVTTSCRPVHVGRWRQRMATQRKPHKPMVVMDRWTDNHVGLPRCGAGRPLHTAHSPGSVALPGHACSSQALRTMSHQQRNRRPLTSAAWLTVRSVPIDLILENYEQVFNHEAC